MPLLVARMVTFNSGGDGSDANFNGLLQASLLAEWIYDQMDPSKKFFTRTTDCQLHMRMESVMIWNLTGKSVALTAYDLMSDDVTQYNKEIQNYEQLGCWFDSGSGNTPPKVGYRWPTSQRNRVLNSFKHPTKGYGEGIRHIFQILSPKSDSLMVHCKVFWRMPATGMEMLKQMVDMRDVHSALLEQTAVLKRIKKAGQDNSDRLYQALPAKVLGSASVWVANSLPVGVSSSEVADVLFQRKEEPPDPEDGFTIIADPSDVIHQPSEMRQFHDCK